MNITSEQFKKAIDLLQKVRDDFQLDKDHEGYLGFLTIGTDIWLEEEDVPTWHLIYDRFAIFKPIMHELGLEIEGGAGFMNLEETVFILTN